MAFMQKVVEYLGLREDVSTPSRLLPPSRVEATAGVSVTRALTLSTVFRAVQVISTSMAQLPVKVRRGGVDIDPISLIKRPSLDMPREAFMEETVASLATTGNCFWLLNRPDPVAAPADITILPNHEVLVEVTPTGRQVYWHKGTAYKAWQVSHLQYLRIPGQARGLGPIQAAQDELYGTLEVRDYASQWLTASDQPTGILSTPKELKYDQALQHKAAFELTGDFAPADGQRRRSIRVLGDGLSYTPIMPSPSDVQFLESQQFSIGQIARLFGIPSSIMNAAVEGKSITYSNIEQTWIEFTRFTLAKYVMEIESALTELLPLGQRAKFNTDALLRTDTKTRYEAHDLAIKAGWKTPDEIRALEDLPPLTPEQIEQIQALKPQQLGTSNG